LSSSGLVLPGRGKHRYEQMIAFAQKLIEIDKTTGFKVSSRGWCYQLEGFGLINKGQFDLIQNLINECRKDGLLPIDFVAEEEARKFEGVENPETQTPSEYLASFIEAVMRAENYYTPDWWVGEKFYIQILVEKIDLLTLFEPICKEYHIPIATSKGWSSILQRAEIAERFKEAEQKGLKPVLLYCGDHDPFGLAISDFLLKNLVDIERGTGWRPDNLIIDRFGLNYNFIIENNLSWIDNLVSGTGKQPDTNNPIVKKYIQQFGIRKVEANAIVVRPDAGRKLCRLAIIKFLGSDALERFQKKRQAIIDTFQKLREETGVQHALKEALDTLER